MKWFIKCLKHYADFSGRARRKEYWMFALFSILFLFAWLVLISGLSVGLGKQGQQSAITIAWWAYILAFLIPSLAVSVRRLHDIGKSSWWILFALIPFIGWLVLFIFFVINSEWGSNQYGNNPKGMENNANSQTKPLSTPYSTIENTVDNDSFGLIPEDFGKYLDEALFFEWKESVKKLNKLGWIQAGLYLIGVLPGILFAIIVTTKKNRKILNLQIRLGITNGDIKQARVNCKNRIKMRRLLPTENKLTISNTETPEKVTTRQEVFELRTKQIRKENGHDVTNTVTVSNKNATEVWQRFTLRLVKNETADLEKQISAINDLRLINMVINCTYKGRLNIELPSQAKVVQKPIEMLFSVHAKELIEKINDVNYLQELNKELVDDSQIDSFNVNQLESFITKRLAELKKIEYEQEKQHMENIVNAIKLGQW